jgi:hypothetical protein
MAAQHSITAGRDCRPESLRTSPGEAAQQPANHPSKRKMIDFDVQSYTTKE